VTFGQGSFRGQPAVSQVPGPRQDPHHAMPGLSWRRGNPSRASGPHYGSPRHRNRDAHPSQRSGWLAPSGRTSGRLARHVPGSTRPLLSPRRARPGLRGSDQCRPGGAGNPATGADPRWEESRPEGSCRHSARQEIPDQGTGLWRGGAAGGINWCRCRSRYPSA
jgi:hypothetical protein